MHTPARRMTEPFATNGELPPEDYNLLNSDAKRELAQRALARRRLIHYTQRFRPNYQAGWVHKFIAAKIERYMHDIERRLSPRIMFTMPPRSGKSILVSEDAQAWMMGHHPEWEFMAASYAVSLPEDFSRNVKARIQLPDHRAIFPELELDPNATAISGWKTTRGGMYLPAGVDGGITGKGAHSLGIDDPVKDQKEADSYLVRNQTWKWWQATADTRLAPGGGVIVIQTRWNDDDLSGRLLTQERDLLREVNEMIDLVLESRDGAKTPADRSLADQRLERLYEERDKEILHWDVVNFPALANSNEWLTENHELVESDECPTPKSRKLRSKNEALHPERYDEIFYRRKRKTTAPSIWSAVYQQNPTPDEGEYWQHDMFRYEPMPTPNDMAGWHVFAAFDFAIGLKAKNDWTVGLIGAQDYDGNVHLINHTRQRTNKHDRLVLDFVLPYQSKLQKVGIERGQIQMSAMPGILALQDEYLKTNRLRYPLVFDEDLIPVTDKLARGKPAQGFAQLGRLYLPENQPWVAEFVARMLRFPNGLWDDEHDALSWLIRMVPSTPPRRQRSAKPKTEQSWRKRIPQSEGKRGSAANETSFLGA